MGVNSLSIPKLCAVLGLLFLCHQSTMGYKTINEVCSPNLSNPSDPRNCDSQQFLICSSTARICSCSPNMIWQKDLDKCTFTLNSMCTDQFGGPSWGQPGGDGHHGGNGPSPGCPSNAYCDSNGTKKCRCDEGAEPNEDYTECNGATNLGHLTSMTCALLISYFVAVKLLL